SRRSETRCGSAASRTRPTSSGASPKPSMWLWYTRRTPSSCVRRPSSLRSLPSRSNSSPVGARSEGLREMTWSVPPPAAFTTRAWPTCVSRWSLSFSGSASTVPLEKQRSASPLSSSRLRSSAGRDPQPARTLERSWMPRNPSAAMSSIARPSFPCHVMGPYPRGVGEAADAPGRPRPAAGESADGPNGRRERRTEVVVFTSFGFRFGGYITGGAVSGEPIFLYGRRASQDRLPDREKRPHVRAVLGREARQGRPHRPGGETQGVHHLLHHRDFESAPTGPERIERNHVGVHELVERGGVPRRRRFVELEREPGRDGGDARGVGPDAERVVDGNAVVSRSPDEE